ncbi:MAG: transposase [Candidatus Taylorbacteria bacterium]
MSTRKTPFALHEHYHLYNRGVDKRIIYLDKNDKKRFVRLLFLCNGSQSLVYKDIGNTPLSSTNVGEKLVAIGAYCLMPNHFHILVREIKEGGIVKFMSKLKTSYSMYFNKKYARTGILFEGEFQSSHLDSDEYLKYIFSYIHLNPLKIFDPLWREKKIEKDIAKTFLHSYSDSSYLDYIGEKRENSLIINSSAFPAYFRSTNDFKTNLFEWINFDPDAI